MGRGEKLIQYLLGASIGAPVCAAVALASGVVVFSSEMEANIREARIEALAAMCANTSLGQWRAGGREVEDLAGWNNPSREQLITGFLSATESDRGLETAIRNACDNILRVRA